MLRIIAMACVPLALASCRGEQAPEPAAPVAPAPVARAADDAPLPGVDEVPAFLRGRAPAAAVEPVRVPDAPPEPAPEEPAPPAAEPTLGDLVKQVQPGDEGEEPFAYVVEADDPPAQEEDPCADVKAAIARREDFLKRTAAERDRFGYVPDAGDATALRLLESLRRCEEHPDDPDCTAPAVERDVSEMEAEAHTVERDPDELDATEDPDAVVQDPQLVSLHRNLAACEKKQVAQPLLQR